MPMTYLKYNNQKGAVAILLTLLILSAMLIIGLGLAAIFAGEVKTSGYIRQSATAFYAADAGSEYALYKINKVEDLMNETGITLSLSSAGSSFTVKWKYEEAGADKWIESTGKYANTNRKVKIIWE
ncbi:MAG: hypothetical protein A2174_00390 [Candidatus Portnoybacteria bacterium RBG_13_41_18]|uniref:Type 4 fimbrial biogenesis protein PilX N-terminal domain-containing protein n=1 Tax=Candidatus Portnoybacteria bacterium RBG_13_41_18 TaxID=1801991 RepID=A0A1G2F5R8_9BACT|nr:MAG: hypothetical protein A2174_00390 [Candidatus Portnoybacteria bacterium RBG_13_41_18]